eukprot:gene7750-8561_t
MERLSLTSTTSSRGSLENESGKESIITSTPRNVSLPANVAPTGPRLNCSAYASPHLKNISTFAETKLQKSFGCFVATFSGFSCFPSQPGVPINSPSVEIEGHQWSVRLYASGVDENAAGFISCYLVHESEEAIRAAVKITLINAKYSSDNHIAATEMDKLMPGKGSTIGWAKFLLQSALPRYCAEDALVLRIDLTIFFPPKTLVVATPRKPRQQEGNKSCQSILEALSSLLFDPHTADVLLLAGGEAIPAHKFMLSLRSDVFRKRLANIGAELLGDDIELKMLPNMINNISSMSMVDVASLSRGVSGEEEGTVTMAFPTTTLASAKNISSNNSNSNNQISSNNSCNSVFKSGVTKPEMVQIEVDVDAVVVREMVRYLYTDVFSNDVLRLHYDQVLLLACQYELVGVQALCAQSVYSTINTENVARILRAADSCGSSELRQAALAFIVKNAREVVQQKDFFSVLTPDLHKEVILALSALSMK